YDALVRRVQHELPPNVFVREQAAGRLLAPHQASDYALLPDGGADHAAATRTPIPRGLTRREMEVAGLVAPGLTNPQIAHTLLLSRRTVGRHIEHIFAKLGVQARAEVAVWITRQSARDHL